MFVDTGRPAIVEHQERADGPIGLAATDTAPLEFAHQSAQLGSPPGHLFLWVTGMSYARPKVSDLDSVQDC